MDSTEQAVQDAVDVLQLILGTSVGAAICIAIGIVFWFGLRIVAHRTENFRLLLRRIKIPYFGLFIVAGAWTGLGYASVGINLENATWIAPLQHTMLIFTIVMMGWLGVAAAKTIEDIANQRADASNSRRLATQAQMVRRLTQVIIAGIAAVAIILTFPSARVAMGSILASAGVISLVAGIAAQDSLSNTFAGLQITFTDALRVGDVINVDGTTGTVEEVTLTYVVLRIWDDRRIIVPSTQFTKNRFENWTRLHSKLLGTIELRLDWRAPVTLIRNEVNRLLENTELWDRRTVNVQVTDSNEEWMLIRIVVSAKNSGTLWDLRCYLREHLIEWVVANAPYAIPRTRIQQEQIVEINQDVSEEEVVRLAQELAELAEIPEHPDDEEAHQPVFETKQEARLEAAKQRAQKVRRKRLRGRKVSDETIAELKKNEATQVITPHELQALQARQKQVKAELEDSAVTDRLYSGTEDAEERSRLFDGPGDEAQRQREETQIMRAFRDGELTFDEAFGRLDGNESAQERLRGEAAADSDKKADNK
ncbi:MAG: mechanosensitive ion channel [Actinomycetaceae bacterium]|nr:mechanosensitive ion channel [Actinomycetaceae bacterium]